MSMSVRIAAISFAIVLFVGGFFAVAGRTDWSWGWMYVLLLIGGNTISTALLWFWNPDLLARRGRMGEGTRTWDKVFLGVFAVSTLATPIVGALDAGRFRDSWMPVSFQWAGVGLFVFGLALFTWAMLINPFFEKTARLQRECGHKVIDTGPYAIVRHPGYTGAIASYAVATPFVLGSWWALVPATVVGLSLLVRTILEDRMLRAELEGYEAYCARVPNKLLPFMWARSKYPTSAR